MIFNGKDLDINILMLYLNLENNGNKTHLGVKKKLNGHGNFANKTEIELQNLKVLGTTQHFLLEQLCANKLHFKVQSLNNCFKRYNAKQ